VFSAALTLMLALAASDDKGPLGVHLTTSVVTERIPLTPLRGPIQLLADPLGARIELRMAKPQPALAAQMLRHAGEICATVTVISTGIELRCRTRRFEAILSSEGNKRFLDIQELRGLPWREGPAAPPYYYYEPLRSGLGSPCPGASPVARGECALQAGRQLEAATQFRAAVESNDRQMAALRLGDLALVTGDPATAIGWYRRAGVAGAFGRMARTRVCEIEGTCLASTDIIKRVFDARGLPEPVRAEMSIRGVRAEAFAGRLDSATKMMWQMIRNGSLQWVCRDAGEVVCRRVLIQAMREAANAEDEAAQEPPKEPAAPDKVTATAAPSSSPDAGAPASAVVPAATNVRVAAAPSAEKSGEKPARSVGLVTFAVGAKPAAAQSREGKASGASELSPAEMAFEVYLALPAWDHGPLAPELSEAAADLARHIGAPVFGGNILSAVAPEVGAAELPAHLYHAAELYLDGDDLARARLVIEYARTRIGKKMPPRWVALEKKIAARSASEEEAVNEPSPKITIDPEAIARELTAARAASARARVARADTEPKKQGDKP
jgi:hypothetical protein